MPPIGKKKTLNERDKKVNEKVNLKEIACEGTQYSRGKISQFIAYSRSHLSNSSSINRKDEHFKDKKRRNIKKTLFLILTFQIISAV